MVTVPAYFNDKQRQATKDAGTIAGLNVLRVVNEPTAASIAYGLDKVCTYNPTTAPLPLTVLNNTTQHNTTHPQLTHSPPRPQSDNTERTVLVYDLGGGTFDVSLVAIDQGVFEVLATAGNTRLGGEDFDNRVIEHLAKAFRARHDLDLRGDAKAMGKLKREAEKAKRALSSQLSARVEIEGLFGGVDFEDTLTRAKFEQLNGGLFGKTLEAVRQVLRDAKVDKADVTDIVLVGGSTRIPKIRDLVEEFFGKKTSGGINPDEAVAFGAAVQGGVSISLLLLGCVFVVSEADDNLLDRSLEVQMTM